MALHELTNNSEKYGWRRLQVIGDPATLKTTILAKTVDRPACLVGLPGEKHTDIITPATGLKIMIFDPPDYSDPKVDWLAVWKDVRLETHKIVREKTYGVFESVILDGSHKAFYACYRAGRQKFASEKGGEKWNGLQGWPWINDEFLEWFSDAYYSDIPFVHWVAWAAKEQTDQTAAENSPEAKVRSIWADYMGKFQRTCMGETNIVYQYMEGGRPYWQIRQTDKVMGVGIRVGPEKAANLPIRIPADWQQLKKLIQPPQPQGVPINGNMDPSKKTPTLTAHEAVLAEPASQAGK